MPRAIWSGAISFGLVSIPVKLYSATSKKGVKFNQLDGRTNARIKQKRVSALDGEEVPYEEIVKGYEVMKDQYVVLTEDELASLSPKASRTIDISDFVELADIDPIMYDNAYFLVPDELSRKSYALLAEAMEESGRVAIATFIMRTKQNLAAVRAVDGRLMLSTMIYADEMVDHEEIPGLEELAEIEVSEAERAMADQLIDSLAADFDPEQYEDTYRLEVMEMIEKKAAGELTSVEVPAASDDAEVIDLLAALEASVNAAKQTRKRHPAAAASAVKKPAQKKPAQQKPAQKKPAQKKPAQKATKKKAAQAKAPKAKKAAKKSTKKSAGKQELDEALTAKSA